MAEAHFLDTLASQSVAAWYNRLLAREDWARAALAAHAGKTARIEAGLVAVFLAVAPGGTLAGATGAPSVSITVAPGALAGALWEPGAALRQLRIEGDAAFAQVLTEVLQRLRPDPAEDLARWVGDAPAERVMATLTAALAQLREGAQRAARQGADFVVAEHPLVLGRQEFEAHAQQLRELQQRLQALEARVCALAAAPRA